MDDIPEGVRNRKALERIAVAIEKLCALEEERNGFLRENAEATKVRHAETIKHLRRGDEE